MSEEKEIGVSIGAANYYECQWEEIFNIINDAITIHDKDFNILLANKAAEKLLCLPFYEILNQKCYKSYHGVVQPPVRCPSCHTLKTGKPSTTEIFEPKLKKYLEIKALPRFDTDNQIIGIVHIVRDFTKRKFVERKLLQAEKKLRSHAKKLEESNAALKVLLKQGEIDKKNIEKNILSNVKHLIVPYLEKLKEKGDTEEIRYLDVITSNLEQITSSLSRKMSYDYIGFTQKEIQIADLIKDGYQDKEIAEFLRISIETVKTHRKKIRKKIGICNKKINLRTFLLSLNSR